MEAKKRTDQPKAKLTIQLEGSEAKDKAIARALIRPSVQAACTIKDFETSKVKVNLVCLVEELTAQVKAVNCGDLKRAEAILITQAHTLNDLFNSMARRACKQDYLKQYETYLRLALKAQSQCRATLETLATIKNPPVIYAKQANFAAGHQQVNNGTPAPTQAREIETEQSQLSGRAHELLSDPRASGIESQINPALETVGEIDRAKVRRG